MCVIAIKPANVAMLTEERFKEMFEHNKDGAGFMYVRGNKVRIRKGFMTFEDFLQGHAKERLTKEDVIVYHFRISTSGGISPENTHPFPVSQSLDEIHATSIDTDMGMAHNGIISNFGNKDISDTQAFVMETVSDPAIKPHLFEAPVFNLVEMALHGFNKMVFLNNKKEYILAGDWFKQDEVIYSNMNWQRSYSFRGSEDDKSKSSSSTPTRPSKKTKRQLRRLGFIEGSDGVWRKPVDEQSLSEARAERARRMAADMEHNVVEVPYGSTTCPKCQHYIFLRDVTCSKCGVFLSRDYYGSEAIN